MADISDVSCEIIAAVGAAKGNFIEAIRYARNKQLKEAKEAYEEGVKNYNQGHKTHHELITKFAQGDKIDLDILLVHAECQMMSAEDFMVIASELIDYIAEDIQ